MMCWKDFISLYQIKKKKKGGMIKLVLTEKCKVNILYEYKYECI